MFNSIPERNVCFNPERFLKTLKEMFGFNPEGFCWTVKEMFNFIPEGFYTQRNVCFNS